MFFFLKKHCLLSSRAHPGAQRQHGHRHGSQHSPGRGTRERTRRPRQPGGCSASHTHSEHAPPAELQITPFLSDSPHSLSQAAEALTGAPVRFARSSPAPPVAHSSSPASEHPSARPRALASPAPSAYGDGRSQHAPALTESAGALIVSVPLLMQHDDPMGATKPPRPRPRYRGRVLFCATAHVVAGKAAS